MVGRQDGVDHLGYDAGTIDTCAAEQAGRGSREHGLRAAVKPTRDAGPETKHSTRQQRSQGQGNPHTHQHRTTAPGQHPRQQRTWIDEDAGGPAQYAGQQRTQCWWRNSRPLDPCTPARPLLLPAHPEGCLNKSRQVICHRIVLRHTGAALPTGLVDKSKRVHPEGRSTNPGVCSRRALLSRSRRILTQRIA